MDLLPGASGGAPDARQSAPTLNIYAVPACSAPLPSRIVQLWGPAANMGPPLRSDISLQDGLRKASDGRDSTLPLLASTRSAIPQGRRSSARADV